MRKPGRIAALLAGAVLLVLALAQLLLPRVAATRISARLSRFGKGVSVSVSAWPAIELLWGDADSLHVHVEQLKASPAQLAGLLGQARGVSDIQASAKRVQVGSLRVSHASLTKSGSALRARAFVSEADVRAALPPGVGVSLVRSSEGAVEARASGTLFGLGASVNVIARASAGKLVVQPVAPLLQGLALTLFADPHVYLQGVGASVHSRQPTTYLLTMAARLP